jgi:hypothetical protein
MTVLDAPTASTPLDRSGGATQRLVVSWQHPVKRSISPVGFLTYDGNAYQFAYIRNALRIEDFRPLLGFADLYRGYSSTELFPLFAQRAMDPRRPDYRRYVERLGLDGEPGPWEQITRSEGQRQGDALQLLPEPTLTGNTLSGLFLVHGMRHTHEQPRMLDGQLISVTREQVNAALEKLRAGDELTLAHDRGNPVNPLALMVLGSSVPVGWVPDLLVQDMQTLMQRGTVSIEVEHINGPDAPWHLRLLARMHATPARGFRFFTGEQWTTLTEAPA